MKNEDDYDHFGTVSDSDRPDCLVTSNFCDGLVAVAPGFKVVAALRAATFARASSACRSESKIPDAKNDKLKHIGHQLLNRQQTQCLQRQ